MAGHADCPFEGFVQDLAERGMSVNHHAELLHSRPRRDGIGTLLDKIGSMDANDVNSNNLPCVLVEENFSNTIPLTLGQGLGVGAEAALGLAEGPSLLLGTLDTLLLRRPDHRDFGVCEARGRDSIVVDLMCPPGNVLDGRDTLGRGSVREHHLAIGVSNAVDIGHHLPVLVLGEDLHSFVDRNESARRLDARILQAHVRSVGDAARGHHSCVDLDGLDVLLRVSVDHLDGDRFFTGDTWGDL
mmetsp:Transcript_7590/g.22269  ORF Transcript_7590/g.22269 Transcript_7590/m.22269 type:complete len:243 (-) Transcript_7590:355-1083(-)